jgi:glucose-1-phosphate thymidylyltransferase
MLLRHDADVNRRPVFHGGRFARRRHHFGGCALKAVILARGLGTRMRAAGAQDAQLDAATAAAADAGLKAMIPIDRPFLDYVISTLADSGFAQVCLVIGPEHTTIREYYAGLKLTRVQVAFAVQEKPRGTADAVAAAEAFAGADNFLALNGDNFYPPAALDALAGLPGPGVAGFTRAGMLRGNVAAERLAAFALLDVTPQGNLAGVTEKPGPELVAARGQAALLGMNAWRFGPSVFDACRAITPSPRGEYEITDAARWLISNGHPIRVVKVDEPVLDLSARGDIDSMRQRLAGRPVRL